MDRRLVIWPRSTRLLRWPVVGSPSLLRLNGLANQASSAEYEVPENKLVRWLAFERVQGVLVRAATDMLFDFYFSILSTLIHESSCC